MAENYVILEEYPSDIEKAVSDRVSDGWIPIGSPESYRGSVQVAMWRPPLPREIEDKMIKITQSEALK